MEGDDRYRGLAPYLASVKVDTEKINEIIGGKLIGFSSDLWERSHGKLPYSTTHASGNAQTHSSHMRDR